MNSCKGLRVLAAGGEQGWKLKFNMRDPCGDRNTLYMGCITVRILVVILYYRFTRRTHWVKRSKGYIGSHLKISYNSI